MTGWEASPEFAALQGRLGLRRAEKFEDEVRARIKGLDDAALRGFPPKELLARTRAGWREYPFPDYRFGVTVRTEYGWAYLSTGEGFSTVNWDNTGEAWRRCAFLNHLALTKSFVAKTLGLYLEALLSFPNATRLRSGVWALVDEFATAEEAQTVKFLHSLRNGTVPMGEGLHAVGKLQRLGPA